jgi:hypothetical protein
MAMRNQNIRMTTTVEKAQLLAVLKTNLETHRKIVQEAREGYLARAKAQLEKRLEQLRNGEVVSLRFDLAVPADYTDVYENSIAMLEWNTDDRITLEADEFRQLVRDEWDWSDDFYTSNSGYSASAAREVQSRKRK